jgi:hypothetical protein
MESVSVRLFSGHVRSAVFAYLRPLFDDFSAEGTLSGVKSLVDFVHRSLQLLLQGLVSDLQVPDGLDRFQLTDIA